MKKKEMPTKTSKRLASKPLHAIKRTAAKVAEKNKEHRKNSPHRSFRMTRRSEVPKYAKVMPWWRLTAQSFWLLVSEWKKVLPIVAAFVPVAWLVSGIYSQDFSDLKFGLNMLGEGALSGFDQAMLLFTGFFSAQSSSISQDALLLLNIIILLLWLSFIWIARYAYAKKRTTVREALYTSGTSFVPFVLLLALLVVQLIPVAVSALIFNSMATGTGFIQGQAEAAIFSVLAVVLIILSFYFIVGTLVALQVVALPGMYPWRALRNARKLVTGRRFSVLRKLIMLAIVMLLGWMALFIPVLLIDNAVCSEGAACWSTLTVLPAAYYLLLGISVAFASVYLYTMYRSLLETEE